MNNRKSVTNYKHSRRTKKILDTLEERQKRETDLLLELDRLADKVLSGKAAPAPTTDELAEMRRTKPEVFDLIDSLLYVADKVGNLPPVPSGEEYDGSTIIQTMTGSRIKYNLDGSQEILSESGIESPVTVLNPPTDTKDALLPPELPENVTDIASIVRAKNFRR